MPDRLFALVYDDDYASPSLLGAIPHISSLRISWELNGGVRDIELVGKFRPSAAYDRYRRWSLQRLAIYDQYCDRPITGDITFLGFRWGAVVVRAKGPWWRLYDGLENTPAAASDNTDDVIEQALTDHASAVVDTSDYSNIAATTADCDQAMPTGTTDNAALRKLMDSGATFESDWIREGDIAYNDTDTTWTVIKAIDSEVQLSVADDIFANGEDYKIYRVIARGHCTGTEANYLVDANAKFQTANARQFSRVLNITDTTVTDVSANPTNQVTLLLDDDIFTVDEQYMVVEGTLLWAPPWEGVPVADVITEMVSYGDGSGNPVYFWLEDPPFGGDRMPQKLVPHLEAYSATAGCDWQVWRKDMSRAEIGRDFGNLTTSVTVLYDNRDQGATQTNNTGDYWTRRRIVAGRHAIAGLANDRASVYVNQQSDAILRRPWTITAPRVQDGNGIPWPLWRMIMEGGGYLRVNDAFPEVAVVTAGYDRERQGRITTMDYNYRRGTMRVTLDDDTRADRRFRELGFDEAINRRLRSMMAPIT